MAVPNRPSASRPAPSPSPPPPSFLPVSVDHRKPELDPLALALSPSPSASFSISSRSRASWHVSFSSVDHQAPAEPDIPRVVPPYNPPPKSANLFMSVSIGSGSSINLLRRRRRCITSNRGPREGRVFLRAGQPNTKARRTVFFEPGRDSHARARTHTHTHIGL